MFVLFLLLLFVVVFFFVLFLLFDSIRLVCDRDSEWITKE